MVDSNLRVSTELSENWKIPFDLVPDIMDAAEPPTISTLRKTCHALYVEGPKHLLRDGVELDSADRIILFARFMLTAKDSSRFTHFRKLDLPMRFPLDSPSAQKDLIDLLSHPSLALETVVLDFTSGLFDCSPYGLACLGGGLGTTQTLRRLVVLRVGEGSASLIRSLPSKLESLTIGVGTQTGSRLDVMSVVRPFSDTLRTLLIKCTLPALSLTDASSYFPSVRTFGIVVYGPVLELLANPAFARAFPSVTHLQLIPAHPPTAPYRSHPPMESQLGCLAHLREGNRVLRLQRSDTGIPPAPSSLMECCSALHHVYASALDCSVSTLRLWQHVLVRDLDLLRTVLGDTRPQYLCFGTQVDDVRQVLSVLDALENHTPPRIDMIVLIPRSGSSWLSRLLKGPRDMVNRSFLELSLRYLPTRLVELNIIIDVSFTTSPGEMLAVRDALEGFTCWASKAAPDMTLTCRLAAEEDWKWPDLGQGDDLEHGLRLRR